MAEPVTPAAIDATTHPITDVGYAERCGRQLAADGALVLRGFFHRAAIDAIVEQVAPLEADAFYAGSTHNVWLTPPDPDRAESHVYNRQVVSSKGLIADDQVPEDSPLRSIYGSDRFRTFLCRVLGIETIHPYADQLSSINVHYAAAGMELGWHFDNSSFAVTMLLQAPAGGGTFEYVPAVRDSASGEQGFAQVERVLDGIEPVKQLDFAPGDLVLFRGRDALHRVTPTEGDVTRLLVVLAYNDQPGVALSESALATFYGRAG